MRSPLAIIAKKRDGFALDSEEIEDFIDGVTTFDIPDYQIAAWLMAVMCRGMSAEETTALTKAIAQSGQQLHIAKQLGTIVVDKHSTGGVGDKVSLIVAPMVAACGLPIAKMSGRGLGHTGGTIDKLEAIRGFQTQLSAERFVAQLREHQLVIAAQSDELAPADGILYALRDVTATIPSIPLIAASIMSKKLAIGSSHILLDVKIGSGAFMKNAEQALQLARLMVSIGKMADVRTIAILSAMEEPLGYAIGNALEIKEAIATLHNEGPADVMMLCCHEVAKILVMTRVATDESAALAQAQRVIASGAAWDKFMELVIAQGGDPTVIENPSLLPQAAVITPMYAANSGIVAHIDAEKLGIAAMMVQAGRRHKHDTIDHATGIVLAVKVGERIKEGEVLAYIHAQSQGDLDQAAPYVLASYHVTAENETITKLPLIYGMVNE